MPIPFFLFRTGSKPKPPTSGSVRSLFAFWQGGAGASPSSTPPPPPITEPSPGGWIAGHGKHYSRKDWKELREAIAAQALLEAKAQEVTGKRREALEQAAQAAEAAIVSVEDAETRAHSIELVKLTRAMDIAMGAAKVADMVKSANAAKAYALQMADDEEEEAIMLLMLH